MRIAQIIAGAPAGGAELFYERLTLALADAGDDVLSVIRRDPGRAARLRQGGVMPLELGFGGPLDLFTRPRLAAALRRFAPRVAIAWMNRAARFTPAGPYVLAGRLGGYYDLSYYRRCDHLIGNTQGIARWIAEQGWPAGRVHYLPNFTPDMGGAVPVLHAEFALPVGAKLILGLGRLHRNKGFDVLIRALARLPDVYAVIAGEGPERAALEALARDLGVADRLRLPGWRSDTAALLAMADIFVCSSRHEPLGNVVLEAFSARRPVVAAAADGPRALIADGTDGVLVPVEDADALAQAIAALCAAPDHAQRLAARARARYETEFALAPVLDRWRHFLAHVEKP